MAAEPDATAPARQAIAEALTAIATREPQRAAYIAGLATQIRDGKPCLLPSWLVVEMAASLTMIATDSAPSLKAGDRVSHPEFGLGTIDHLDQYESPVVLFDGRRSFPDETRMVIFVGCACDELAIAEMTTVEGLGADVRARLLNLEDAAEHASEPLSSELLAIIDAVRAEPATAQGDVRGLDVRQIAAINEAAEFLDSCAGEELEVDGKCALALVEELQAAFFDEDQHDCFHLEVRAALATLGAPHAA